MTAQEFDREVLDRLLFEAAAAAVGTDSFRATDVQTPDAKTPDAKTPDVKTPEQVEVSLLRQIVGLLHQGGRWRCNEFAAESGDSSPALDWSRPQATFRYPVRRPAGNLAASGDAQTFFEQLFHDAAPGDGCERQELQVLAFLTRGACRLQTPRGWRLQLTSAHRDALERWLEYSVPGGGDAARSAQARQLFETALAQPFTLGAPHHETSQRSRPSAPPTAWSRLVRLPRPRFRIADGMNVFAGSLRVRIHPLQLERVRGQWSAFFPIEAGLAWGPDTEPAPGGNIGVAPPAAVQRWSQEKRERLWDALQLKLEEWGRGEAEIAPEPISIVLETPHLSPARYLMEGSTRLDRHAVALSGQLHGIKWPRRWSSIRPWKKLVEKEIERLKSRNGEDAPQLVRRHRLTGEVVYELTAEAEDELATREGVRGFRRLCTGPDGVTREYFIKRLETPGGQIEARFSWYGNTWAFSRNAPEEMSKSLRAFAVRQAQPTLFEELREAEQQQLDGQLRLMESIRGARLIIDYLLRVFGRDGANPVLIPAWQLRVLLGCDDKKNGFERVKGCLRALQELHFTLRLKSKDGTAHAFGALLGEVRYLPRGAGEHTDGDFLLQLAPSAIGCLQAFAGEPAPRGNADSKTLESPPPQTPLITSYNWNKSLDAGAQETLRKGYIRSELTLAPFYDQAHGFSAQQAALLRWIERELTLNRDPARQTQSPAPLAPETAGRETPNDYEPRLYLNTFCPLLPTGRAFYGALGHFKQNPECGRKLAVILAEIGYHLPSKRASAARRELVQNVLDDMRVVVEESLGGIVAVRPVEPRSQSPAAATPRRAEIWHRLDELADVAPGELLYERLWYFFVAPDFRERLTQTLERYHAQRFARGEASFPIKVISDTPNAGSARTESTLGQRLLAARKERSLTQAQVGQLFGVSQKTIAVWEKFTRDPQTGETRGKPIPLATAPLVERWIKTAIAPTAEEIAQRRRKGKKS